MGRRGGKAELRANVPRKRACGGHHSGFNLHLLAFPVELANQVIHLRHHRGNVPDDQGIRALIGEDFTSRGEKAPKRLAHCGGLGVTQNARTGDLLDGFGLSLEQVALGFSLFLDCVLGGNAEHVAFQLLVHIVVAQNDVQGLVPRHVIEHQGHRPFYRGIQHHIQAADLVNQAEEILQVHILQVHRNRLPGILAGRLRCARGALLLRGLRRLGRRLRWHCWDRLLSLWPCPHGRERGTGLLLCGGRGQHGQALGQSGRQRHSGNLRCR